jgi:tripartite-type tricarboxylate transporter receptor subunit TctC
VRLGRPFIIENRPGAGSALAAEAVVRAAPDGDTLPWVSTANPISTTLYDNLSFDFRDIAPVASMAQVPLVLEVNPSLPANNLSEFRLCQIQPGQGQLGDRWQRNDESTIR